MLWKRRPSKYVDFHCHILPGLDDGAKTWEDSMNMARAAARAGAHIVIATPHFMRGTFEPDPAEIHQLTEELQKRVEAEGLNLRILPGCEVYLSPEICEDYVAKRILTIANGLFVLVEFPSGMLPPYALDVIFELGLKGAGVVIAHPERNSDIRRDPEIVRHMVEGGAFIQINAGSLIGAYGKHAQVCAENLARERLVHLIGSDAHSGSHPSVLDRGADASEAVSRLIRLYPDFLDESEKTLKRILSNSC